MCNNSILSRKLLLANVALAICTIVSFGMQTAFAKEPATIAEAIQQVKAITNPNPLVQATNRADRARQIVHSRVDTLNSGWGTFLQTIPMDAWNLVISEGIYKSRAEAIAKLRNMHGMDSVRAAWILKGGMCYEHASLMKMILNGAGTPCQLLHSNSPHDFPIINLSPAVDPDIPFTWGDKFIVPDSWDNMTYTGPDAATKLWHSSHHFDRGNAFVWSNQKVTTRERLQYLVRHGKDYTEQHCQEYKDLVAKYSFIPENERLDPSYPPEWCMGKSCDAWLGVWQTPVPTTPTPTPKISVMRKGGVYQAYMNNTKLTISTISETSLVAAVTTGGESYTFKLEMSADKKAASGKWSWATPYVKKTELGMKLKLVDDYVTKQYRREAN